MNIHTTWHGIPLKIFTKAREKPIIQGSRDAFKLAFKRGLTDNGEIWMQMLKDRNPTSHTYNEETADEIVAHIFSVYFPAYIALQHEFEKALIRQSGLFKN